MGGGNRRAVVQGNISQAAILLPPTRERGVSLVHPILMNIGHQHVLFQSFVLTLLVLMLGSNDHRLSSLAGTEKASVSTLTYHSVSTCSCIYQHIFKKVRMQKKVWQRKLIEYEQKRGVESLFCCIRPGT